MGDTAVEYASEFEILPGNERARAAEMVPAPGKSEGGPQNRNDDSE